MDERRRGRWSFRLIRDDNAAEDTTLSVSAVVENYLGKLQVKGTSPRNLAHAMACLRRLIAGLRIENVDEISKARIEQWRQGRVLAGASNNTVNHEIDLLCAALNHAVRFGLIEVSPLQGLEKLPTTPKHRVRQAHALNDDEIARLLEAARRIDARCTRGSFPREPTLRTLIATGARWNELVQTTWADLDFDRKTLTLRAETTKTDRTRTIPLAPSDFAVVVALREAYVRVKGELPTAGSRIFLAAKGEPWAQHTRNFLSFLHAAMRGARIPYRDSSGKVVHVHSLRHTAATRWARQGMPLVELQRLLGHSNPRMTTQVYIDAKLETARQWILPLPFPE